MKVLFSLNQDDDGYPPVKYESVWAIHQDGDRYRIDNIPFFAREATLGDVVEAVDRDGELRYIRLVEQSGNSLIRVVYYEGTEPNEIRKQLEGLGCSTELYSDYHLIAVNVPTEAKLSEVQAFLQEGFNQDLWDYEEALLRQ